MAREQTIVVALGGNALLKRGEPLSAEAQEANVRVAARELAPLAQEYRLVIAHGNGPQVGLLALQAAAYTGVAPYPLDVLGAESQGMIAYMLERELGNLLPPDRHLATVLTMVEVDPDDPAFGDPTKFVGPGYRQAEARELERRRGWAMRRDGSLWRRVVPSPEPKRIVEIEPIRWLVERDAVVICAGGGGIPTAVRPDQPEVLVGVEAVIDKDLAAALLAQDLGARLLVMATDVAGVYESWGTGEERLLEHVTPAELAAGSFPSGSMGPKVEAAVRFVRATGGRAVIGRLDDLGAMVAGHAGTNVTPEPGARA